MSEGSIPVAAGRCRIRPFSLCDLDSALQVEADSFTFPWSKNMFLSELGRHTISRCFVAEFTPGAPLCDQVCSSPEENVVAGFIMSWLVADELHITNLAVAPAHRRSGLAASLIEHTLEDARNNGAKWCQLEVRLNNIPARSLYRKFGFRAMGVRKGYYQDGEDALVLGKELSV
jgi:ribosomal-protein-alanine N-acetyltransferase